MEDKKACEICDRIRLIKEGNNPHFVAELATGYVVVGDYQLFRGYALFLFKDHREELQELDENTKCAFLMEMSTVAEAVSNVFGPDKLNYELLGNGEPHLHWHIFPRYKDDPAAGKPVWVIPKEERYAARPAEAELERMKSDLRAELKKLIPTKAVGM